MKKILLALLLIAITVSAQNFKSRRDIIMYGGAVSVPSPPSPQPPAGYLYMLTSGGKNMLTSDSDTMLVKIAYYKSQAVTGTNLLAATTATIYGDIVRTETVEDSGSVYPAIPYMRWWLDSTETVINGDFVSDISGWNSYGTPDTLEWVANGGGYTGAMHIGSNSAADGAQYNYGVNTSFKYRVQFDLNITALEAGNAVSVEIGSIEGWFRNFPSAGEYNIDTVVSIGTQKTIRILNNGNYTSTFYVDNFSMIVVVDSSQTLAKVLTLTNLIEDTTYYYDCVTIPVGGNDSYNDGVDSNFVTPLTTPITLDVVAVEDYELNLEWVKATSKDWGWTQIWRKYNHIDSSYLKIDSVSIVATIYSDSGLAFGSSYKYKVRHRVNNYSAYSNESSGIVTAPDYQFTFEPDNVSYGNIDSTASSTGVEEGGVFIADAEEGDTTDFTSIDISGTSTFDASIDTVKYGTYSYEAHYNNTGADKTWGIKEITADDETWGRVYFWLPTSPITTTGWTKGAVIELRTDTQVALQIGMRSFGSEYLERWYLQYRDSSDDLTTAESTTNWTTGAWHLIEWYYKAAAGESGGTQVWIDSTLVFDDIDKNTNGMLITSVAVGCENIDSNFGEHYFYFDNLRVDSLARSPAYEIAPGESADSVITLFAINNSSGVIILNDITGEALPFTVVADSTLPEAVTDGDTLGITITLNLDTSGTFNQTMTFETDFTNQNVTLYANVLGGEGGSGGAGDCGDTPSALISVPTNLSATGYQDSVVLTWTQVAGDSALDTYIMRGAENECCGNEVGHPCYDSTDAIGSTTWTDINVNGGSVYDYKLRVKGETAVGVSIWGDADSAYVLPDTEPDTTAPDAPTNLMATGYYSGGSTWINVSWIESVSSDKDSIRLYATVIDDPEGTKSWILSLAEGTTEYNDTTVDVNESRGYYVTQLDDSSNESSVSNADSGLVPSSQTTPPPTAPSNLVGTGDTLAIHLTWTDNSDDEDSFRVYRDDTWIVSLAAEVEAYTDTPLVNYIQYAHYITAYSTANGESNASNTTNTYTSDTTSLEYNRWYVNKNANGGNNGTSWANAWESFSAISWGSIEPGDILYISGGLDSTIYKEQLNIGASGTAANLVTVRNGLDAGHNGKVIIDGDAVRQCIYIRYQSYVRVVGITVEDGVYQGSRGMVSVLYPSNVIYLDSISSRDNNGWGIFLAGEPSNRSLLDSIYVRYCNIVQNTVTPNQSDGFMGQFMRNIFLIGNYIRSDNTNQDGHSEPVYIQQVTNYWIEGNKFISTNIDIKHQVFHTHTMDGTMIVFNNLFWCKNTGITWITNVYINESSNMHGISSDANTTVLHFYNNTIIGSNNYWATRINVDTAYVKNNIFYNAENTNGWVHFWDITTPALIDYNLYGNVTTSNNIVRLTDSDILYTMAEMNALGSETGGAPGNRDRVDPLFIDIDDYDTDGCAVGEGSPCINAGETLGAPYNVDINGNVRSDPPDIGAYEQ